MTPLQNVFVLLLLSSNILLCQYNYLCDFSTRFTSNTAGNWNPQSSTCQVTQTNSWASGAVTWLGGDTSTKSWTDYTIESTFRINSSNNSPWSGLIFRATSIGNNWDSGNYYLVALLADDNRIYNVKFYNNSFQQQTYSYIQIFRNVDYTLQIDVSGNSWTIYVNGVQRHSGSDNSFSAGSIGLRCYQSVVIFKTLYITLPTIAPTPSPTDNPTPSPTTATPTTAIPTALPTAAMPTTTPTSHPALSTILPTTAIPTASSPTTLPTTRMLTTNSPTTTTAAPTTAVPTTAIPTTGTQTTSNSTLTTTTTKSGTKVSRFVNTTAGDGIINAATTTAVAVDGNHNSEETQSFTIPIWMIASIGSFIIIIICIICFIVISKCKKKIKKKKQIRLNIMENIQLTNTQNDENNAVSVDNPVSKDSNIKNQDDKGESSHSDGMYENGFSENVTAGDRNKGKVEGRRSSDSEAMYKEQSVHITNDETMTGTLCMEDNENHNIGNNHDNTYNATTRDIDQHAIYHNTESGDV